MDLRWEDDFKIRVGIYNTPRTGKVCFHWPISCQSWQRKPRGAISISTNITLLETALQS